MSPFYCRKTAAGIGFIATGAAVLAAKSTRSGPLDYLWAAPLGMTTMAD